MKLDRHRGALLLLVGGVLEAIRLLVFGLVSVPLPDFVSMSVYGVPSTCIGVGLIAVAVSTRGRARIPLLIAGPLTLATVVVNIVQIATDSPLGPGPSFLVGFVCLVAVVVAAALLLSDPALRGPARWALAIPAAGMVLLIPGLYAPALLGAWIDLLPGIGFALAGALLLRRTSPYPLAAQPAVG